MPDTADELFRLARACRNISITIDERAHPLSRNGRANTGAEGVARAENSRSVQIEP